MTVCYNAKELGYGLLNVLENCNNNCYS